MKRLFKSSFYKRIQLSLFVFILLPLAFASIFSYMLIKDVVIEKAENSSQGVVNIIADDLNKNIEDIIYASNIIGNPGTSTFEELRQFKDVSELSSYENYQRYKRISDSLSLDYSKTAGLDSKVFFVNKKGFIINGLNNIFTPEALADIVDMEWINHLQPNKLYWQEAEGLETKFAEQEESYYFAVRVFNDSTSKEKIGAVFIGIPYDYFKDLFATSESGTFLLYDDKDQLIYRYPADDPALVDDEYFEVHAHVGASDWQVIYRSSVSNITEEISQMFSFYAIVIMACVLVFLIISIFISRSLYRPLNQLGIVAKQFGNENFDIRFPVSGDDEIATLGTAFNNMLDQIKRLFTRVKQKQEEKRLIELQALFAQIQPHFLINTLNSIKYNLILDGDTEHSEKINSLMRLLRANMQVDELTTLEHECKLLVDYNEIMQIRNDRTVDLVIDLPKEIETFQVPRLLLQPLVENAIVHGFEEEVSNPSIYIQIQNDKGKIIIEIVDNGKGMTDEQLKRINASLDEPLEITEDLNADHSQHRVGLRNVSQRLKMTYGSESRLSIKDNDQLGVTIRVEIPKIDEL
ncbi:MAG TPA: sensor histidine kinase [Virgibacillus sp.]|nr:sensor histidine kinase [Virgibacillus sp.]